MRTKKTFAQCQTSLEGTLFEINQICC